MGIDAMTVEQVQQWFALFGDLGYIVGFLLPFIEAFLPILPIIVFVIVNVNAYGLIIGTILAWLGTVCGSFIVFWSLRQLAHLKYIQRVKSRKTTQRLISFVDRRGVIPIFILLCFPFTPSAVVNIVASVSHIKPLHYFWVLLTSKFIMIGMIGWLGNDITTLFTNPTKMIIVICVIIIVWLLGRKLEQHFMHNSKE